MSILVNLISAEITDKETEFDGKTLTRPRLITLDTVNRTYVVDVDIGKDNPLYNVPIASGDGALTYADVGAAVKLTRSPSGRFEVTGFSKRMPGTHTRVSVSIPRIDFAPHLLYQSTVQPPDPGVIVIGTPQQVGITTRVLAYDELASYGGYGVVPYGAIALYKDGVFQEIIT